MNMEHGNAALFAALAQAQGAVENATKGSINPHFKSRYADLAEVLNTVRPVFSAYGLGILQSSAFDGATVSVTTTITHKDGGYVSSTASCVPAKFDAPGIGACTTYLRRYGLAAMTGVAQEDDDGNAASGRPSQPADNSRQPADNARQPDRSQAARAFVTESIKAIGSLKTETALDDWYAENALKLARLKESYADEAKMIAGALAEQRKTLVRVAAE
jgi:hypothetical protein